MDTTTILLIISGVVALIAVALGAAYTTGALDGIIEQIGIYFFKAKAKAEEKKLEAQGLKEGQDFFKGMFTRLCLVLVLEFCGEIDPGWNCANKL